MIDYRYKSYLNKIINSNEFLEMKRNIYHINRYVQILISWYRYKLFRLCWLWCWVGKNISEQLSNAQYPEDKSGLKWSDIAGYQLRPPPGSSHLNPDQENIFQQYHQRRLARCFETCQQLFSLDMKRVYNFQHFCLKLKLA